MIVTRGLWIACPRHKHVSVYTAGLALAGGAELAEWLERIFLRKIKKCLQSFPYGYIILLHISGILFIRAVRPDFQKQENRIWRRHPLLRLNMDAYAAAGVRMEFVSGCCWNWDRREINEDSLALQQAAVRGRSVCMALLCSGAGDRREREKAGGYAAERLIEWFYGDYLKLYRKRRGRRKVLDALLKVFDEINRELYEYGRKRGLRLGSSVSMLLLHRGGCIAVHTGNGRIYRVRGRRCRLMTRKTSAEEPERFMGMGGEVHSQYRFLQKGSGERLSALQRRLLRRLYGQAARKAVWPKGHAGGENDRTENGGGCRPGGGPGSARVSERRLCCGAQRMRRRKTRWRESWGKGTG